MTNSQTTVGGGMRPNIEISHELNGRVKDYAAEHDMNTTEAYRKIIKAGLREVTGDDDIDHYYPTDCVLSDHTAETPEEHEQHMREVHD